MPNQIPEESRRIVERRERNRCARCGGRGLDWHHRRRRSVRGVHQHCACNGVLLCRTCHSWVHANPTAAKGAGLIVRSYESEPGTVPAEYVDGWWELHCDGSMTPLRAGVVVFSDGVPRLDS